MAKRFINWLIRIIKRLIGGLIDMIKRLIYRLIEMLYHFFLFIMVFTVFIIMPIGFVWLLLGKMDQVLMVANFVMVSSCMTLLLCVAVHNNEVKRRTSNGR